VAEETNALASSTVGGGHGDRGSGNLALHAYASLARALPATVRREQFVAGDLAAQLERDFSLPEPPRPGSPIDSDAALMTRLDGLPESVKAAWREIPPREGAGEGACLLQTMAACGEVSLETIEALCDHLTQKLAAILAQRYSITGDMARYLAAETQSEAVTRALERAPADRIDAFMNDLESRGKLSGDRVLHYARRGDSPLFYAAVGRCAGLNAEMVEAFIEDGGLAVLDRILMRTEFMQAMREAILAAYREGTAQADAQA